MHIRVTGPYDRANVALLDRPLVFGRDPRCDVVLEDPAVAPRHAVVQRTPRGVEVMDLGPPGGLLLDGTPVRKGIVGPGRAVRIGASTLTFDVRDELARAGAPPPAVHAPGAFAAPPPHAPSSPSHPAYVPPAPPAPPKKGGAGLAIALALLALVGLAAAGGLVAWRRFGDVAAPSASATAPAPPPRASSSAPAARPSASPGAAASATTSARVAPNATAGIEPLVFDRNPFADD